MLAVTGASTATSLFILLCGHTERLEGCSRQDGHDVRAFSLNAGAASSASRGGDPRTETTAESQHTDGVERR